ncbi:mechanosensitive ion channel protein MscS [Halarcobacter mediterraneus]|uniref:Mechanosensitive ion channel protein MscS n=1 Tax=Halarcobacter mediterraneus TaxID=2023153 RepID=A0A4Q1B2F9_9BACT|nr:mechanosensitive ion channel domain-containing protein [Halarcobacter mediterraneus]RXK12109.1 mechanosensitive ion channel protein MscS [Halarcobacter mediterraneus]
MKFFLLLFTVFTISFTATIDTKLYDIENNSKYFEQIENNIRISIQKAEKPSEIIEDEKKYLKILKKANTKIVSIEKYNKEIANSNEAINALKFLIQVDEKENEIANLSIEIQENLSYLKKRIENILEIEKNRLLIYQLQFAYNKIEKNNLEKKITLYEKHKIEVLNKIEAALNNLNIENLDTLNTSLTTNNKQIEEIDNNINLLKANLQREKINDNIKKIEELEKKVFNLNTKKEDILSLTIYLSSKKLLLFLKEKNEKAFLEEFENLNSLINYSKKFKYLNEAFLKLSKKRLNNTKLVLATSNIKITSFFDSIKTFFNTTLVVFNEQAITPMSLIKAIFLILIGILIGKIYKRWILKVSSKWPNISEMSLKISSNVGFYLIIFITFIIALGSLGIDMTSISLIAGALSIGIGFGLQTVVSNFISGIILMFERTIRIGDVIEINDLLKGTVTDIRVRSTTVKTFDNIDIVVPNSSFIQNNVINWTLEDKSRRLHVPFGVAYGTKIEEVKEIVLRELLNSDLTFIKNDKDKQPDIRFENMNNSSVDLELLVWIKTNDKLTPNALKSDFLLLIYNALYKNNIEIPFPQLDLHIKR